MRPLTVFSLTRSCVCPQGWEYPQRLPNRQLSQLSTPLQTMSVKCRQCRCSFGTLVGKQVCGSITGERLRMWSHLLLGPLADGPGGSCSESAHFPLRRSLKPGGPCDNVDQVTSLQGIVYTAGPGAGCSAGCCVFACCRMHAAFHFVQHVPAESCPDSGAAAAPLAAPSAAHTPVQSPAKTQSWDLCMMPRLPQH